MDFKLRAPHRLRVVHFRFEVGDSGVRELRVSHGLGDQEQLYLQSVHFTEYSPFVYAHTRIYSTSVRNLKSDVYSLLCLKPIVTL